MFDVQLFLGFPADSLYLKELQKANPHIVAQFIQNSDDYLREIHHNDLHFFGKLVGKMTSLQQLELLESNIYSLLKRLVPNFPYDEVPLYLFSIDQAETHGTTS